MKLILIVFFATLNQFAFSQAEDQFFVFDNAWKPTKIENAVYFLRIRQVTDSNYDWVFYKLYGPRIKQESYKDEKATIRNGIYSYYRKDGSIDSSGNYLNNVLNGPWYFWNPKGKVFRQKDYDHGLVVKDTLFPQQKDDKKNDELEPGEKESEYPGGVGAWSKYLSENLHYPDRAISAEVMGDVQLQFIVDTEGRIVNPEINKSVEYSLDEEALRIIKESVRWQPAVQDGRLVRSYKIQPIKFRLN